MKKIKKLLELEGYYIMTEISFTYDILYPVTFAVISSIKEP